MDFPNDVITNEFFIENVAKICWSQWSRMEAGAGPFIKLAPEVIYELREHHAHVFHEVGSPEVWLFHFLPSPSDEFDTVLVAGGFFAMSRGSLDMTGAEIVESRLSGGSREESEHSVYRRAMIALCASLCHHLISGKREDWMLLGSSSCIDLSTVNKYVTRQSSYDLSTRIIKFEPTWDPAGRMIISPTFLNVQGLCQVAAVANEDIQIGTPLLLSPSGVSTRYRGQLSEASTTTVIESSKSRCMQFLISQGHSISPDTDWILVETRTDSENVLTTWLASHAFLHPEYNDSNSQDEVSNEVSNEKDPLARAETWYLGRAARAAKVDMIRRDIDLQNQQLKAASEHDISSEIPSPAFREIVAPQDISGIYPTPPDGLLSQTPASNVQLEASPKFSTVGRADDHSGYSDDAYEGMDIDLVGEADFNFFDEPGVEEALSEAGGNIAGISPDLPATLEAQEQSPYRAEIGNAKLNVVADGKDLSLGNNSPTNSSSAKGEIEDYVREDNSQRDRGSFNPLSLSALSFDRKYGHGGRFGHIPLKAVSSTSKKHEIFQIGRQVDSTETVDNDSEETSTDGNFQEYNIDEDLSEANEESSGHVATPESSMDTVAEVTLQDPPPAILSLINNHDAIADFTQALESMMTARTFVNHSSFIHVAQLVADQVQYGDTNPSASSSKLPEHLDFMFSKLFPSAKRRSLLDMFDTGQIEKLGKAAIRIQRIGKMTDVASSAIPFWEELSLGPQSGPKNVNAFCIFPMKEYLVRPVKTFLEMMKSAYQVCNLGKHTLNDPQSPYPHGLVPIPNDGETFDKDASVKFIKHVSGLRMTGENTMIYMLNTWNEGAIPEMCRLFLALFHMYRKALDQELETLRNPNDLVLQIVPASMVFDDYRIVVPSPSDYKQLAFQIYDRCGPTGNDGQTPFVCAPAACLAKPMPDINMLSANADHGQLLHLAYKWETGQQWLTAYWTNDAGTIQWNAAYWLSEDEDLRTSFSRAATAMLETTKEIVQSERPFQSTYIVKDSPFMDFELEAWTSLTNSGLHIAMVEFDPDPSLALFPSRSSSTTFDIPASPSNIPHTGAAALSPNAVAHASTPGGSVAPPVLENDPEAKLIDITDETWAVMTGSPTRDIALGSPHPEPLLTGYLVKRAGPHDEDGLRIMKLSIRRDTHSDPVLIKRLLHIYRNLDLLAKVRRVDQHKATLPIHIATVKNTHTALCRTLCYG